MAQNVFFGLTGVVKCIKSGQIIVISHDLGPQKVAMTGKWDPLFQVLPGSPENPKNPSFFLSATVWGGEVLLPGFGEVSLAEICESSSLHSRRCLAT